MNLIREFLFGVCVFTLAAPCFAAENWLLLFRNDHYSLIHATDEGFRPVVEIGNRTTFGSSENKIGLVSRDLTTGSGTFVVVDKATKTIDGSWPLDANPVVQLDGPAPTLILQGRFAYFANLRSTLGGQSTQPNSLGGSFDLIRISVANGTAERVPLPEDCLDPRIATVNGRILVYTFNGTGLWRFDNTNKSLEKIVLKTDLDFVGESTSDVGGGRFADYLALPHAGVYRLSRSGTIRRFLDEQLALDVKRGNIEQTKIKGQVIRLFPAMLGGSPNIGVLRKHNQRMQVLYLDPRSGKVNLEVEVEPEVVPNSVLSLADDSFVYTDPASKSIRKVTSNGDTIELWNIAEKAPDSWPSLARVIE